MVSVADTTAEAGIERAIHEMEALHYNTHPAHARHVLSVLQGHVNECARSLEDDPLLYAYLLRDHLPYLARFTIMLQKWSAAVIDATPDQIQETGAQ